MPSLALVLSFSEGCSQRMTERMRKSTSAMRPWRSPAARRRWEEEGSSERKSRRRGRGVQRTEVIKGDNEEEDEDEGEGEEDAEAEEGGGRGTVEMSWSDRESTTETEEPEAKARRPAGLRSADPKLLRLGGPGNMESHDSVGDGLGMDILGV